MRGVTFNEVDANAGKGGDGSLEVMLNTDDTDFFVECDGLHSAVREALLIPFLVCHCLGSFTFSMPS